MLVLWLIISLTLDFCSGRGNVVVKPKAIWTFAPENSKISYSQDELSLVVGSGGVFDSSCPSSVTSECRSVDLGKRSLSQINIYRPQILEVTTEFSMVMHINTDGVSYTRVNGEIEVERVLMDFMAYQISPAFKFYEFNQNRFMLDVGADDSNYYQTSSVDIERISTSGWIKIGFSVKYLESSKECEISFLNKNEQTFVNRGILACQSPASAFDGSLVFGHPAFQESSISFVNHFVGKISCIQIYNVAIEDRDNWLDACDPGTIDVASLPIYDYYYFGVDHEMNDETTLPTTLKASTIKNSSQAMTTEQYPPLQGPSTASESTSVEELSTATEGQTTSISGSTNYQADSTQPEHDMDCACGCASVEHNKLTESEVEDLVEEIEKELLIDKQSTSSEKRKKISATDDRTSAHYMGTVGVLMCTTVVLIIVSADAASLLTFILGCFK